MKTFIRRYDLSPFRLARDISYALAGAALLIALYVSVATAARHNPQQVQASFFCYNGASLDKGLRAPDNNEVPLASGVGRGGVAMLIYVNPETKTWSFVIIEPTGRACMVAHGVDYEASTTDMFPPKNKKQGGI